MPYILDGPDNVWDFPLIVLLLEMPYTFSPLFVFHIEVGRVHTVWLCLMTEAVH